MFLWRSAPHVTVCFMSATLWKHYISIENEEKEKGNSILSLRASHRVFAFLTGSDVCLCSKSKQRRNVEVRFRHAPAQSYFRTPESRIPAHRAGPAGRAVRCRGGGAGGGRGGGPRPEDGDREGQKGRVQGSSRAAPHLNFDPQSNK